jgi:hypothetical protein
MLAAIVTVALRDCLCLRTAPRSQVSRDGMLCSVPAAALIQCPALMSLLRHQWTLDGWDDPLADHEERLPVRLRICDGARHVSRRKPRTVAFNSEPLSTPFIVSNPRACRVLERRGGEDVSMITVEGGEGDSAQWGGMGGYA